MHCKQARDLLLLACEHELTGEERTVLASHLDECPECRRFVEAMRHWGGGSPLSAGAEGLGFVAGGTAPKRSASPDLTERVLASVRPLPPPWVYHDTLRERRRTHVIGFAIGALAVSLTFVAVSLALIVALASGGATGATSHMAMDAVVGVEVRQWFGTLPDDLAHSAITLGALALFASLGLRWFHAFAIRAGHDRHSH